MIGITVATPGWRALAVEAAARWTRFTGLPAQIVEAADRRAVRDAKLSLHGACWFFDADLWFVRMCELPKLRGDCIFGTPVVPSTEGRRVIREWAARAGIDPACWISSGIYGADWSGAAGTALGKARAYALMFDIENRDEEPLNVGLQRARLPAAMLPSAFNWHPRCGVAGYNYEPPEGINAIHAGGVPFPEKFSFLQKHTT
jgi:hypothetical protein